MGKGGGVVGRGRAAGDDSCGGGGAVLDMIGCQKGLIQGSATPRRVSIHPSPPVVPVRMAAGVRVFLDNPGARGLIEILVAATWKGEREILMDSLDGWKL